MNRSVSIRNFKCLRSVDVELEPLTVLIGKNDTGKSSFLQALTFFVAAYEGPDTQRKAQVTQGVGLKELSVSARLDGRDYVVDMAIGKSRNFGGPALEARTNPQSFAESPWKGAQPPYCLDPDLLRSPAQVGALSGPLPPKGEHLVDAVDRLPLEQQNLLQKAFRERVRTIRQIVPARVSGKKGYKELTFDLSSGGNIPAAQASDGVMLLLAFLTIMHDKHAPGLIMIEEPENGIHPKQLEYVVKSLLSLTKNDPPIQVILTTHSPYVLDFVPKEAVRVFARVEDREVVVRPFAEIAEIADMLSSGFSLGEAWFNTDENELIRDGGNAG